MSNINKISDILALGARILNSESAFLESRILLADILKIDSSNIFINYDKEISNNEKSQFIKYINRRKLYEPIAYIIGWKEFYSLKFLVDKNVLVPRPETEMLVDEVIQEYLKNYQNKNINILDLGTGSGVIAISMAANIKYCKITALDISAKALKLATKNAKLNKVASKINFVKSNWYNNLLDVVEKFDIIVSNPPYIAENEQSYMSKEAIQYEPKSALFAEANGLACYYNIIAKANKFLEKNGKIFLEIGFNQAQKVIAILEDNQFTNIKLLQDIAGNDRVLIAQYR